MKNKETIYLYKSNTIEEYNPPIKCVFGNKKILIKKIRYFGNIVDEHLFAPDMAIKRAFYPVDAINNIDNSKLYELYIKDNFCKCYVSEDGGIILEY